MLDRTRQQHDGCPRCGAAPERTVTRRVAGMERGFVHVFECQSCGYVTCKDVPQQASNT